MRPKTLGLVGPENSAALGRLKSALESRGMRVVLFHLEGFPGDLSLSVSSEGVRSEGRGLDEDLAAALILRGEYMSPLTDWCPSPSDWARLANGLERAVRAHQEARSVRVSVYRLWSDRIPVINPARAQRICMLAPASLRRLAEARIKVVPFVSGNDLERIACFVDAHQGRCRARRMGQASTEEWPVDLDYLRDHHLDFDHFPLLVRRAFGTPGLHVLAVGGKCLGAAVWDSAGERWQPHAITEPQVAQLATRTADELGLYLALVHLDQGDGWEVVHVDAQPDLDRLADDAGLDAVSSLTDLLIDLGRGERLASARSEPPRAAASLPAIAAKPLRIGITGQDSNEEVAALARALEQKGAIPVLLELPWFPALRAVHECADGGRMARDEFGDLSAIFLRSTGAPSPVEAVQAEPAEPWPERRAFFSRFARDAAESFLFQYSLLETLARRIPVVNPPLTQEIHRTKVHQVFSLIGAGFPLPATRAGNDRDSCARFVAAQGGERCVVVKPIAGIHKTELLSERGLDRWLESGPVILQRYVRGDTIRAYIVGGRWVGAGKILHDGEVDSSLGQRGVEPVELPEEVARLGWAAARHLGLAWTGMDFMRDATTGEYFILECNAAAMFAGFSRMTGFDVAGAIADLLLGLALRSRD